MCFLLQEVLCWGFPSVTYFYHFLTKSFYIILSPSDSSSTCLRGLPNFYSELTQKHSFIWFFFICGKPSYFIFSNNKDPQLKTLNCRFLPENTMTVASLSLLSSLFNRRKLKPANFAGSYMQDPLIWRLLLAQRTKL